MINANIESQRQLVVDITKSWVGTPYHHMGRAKGIGVDCGMILAEVYHEAGIIPPIEIEYYPPDWAMHRSEERYLGWLEPYVQILDPNETPQAGDILLYQFGRCISHSAIVVDYPVVIHSYINQGVIYGSATEPPLQGRLKCIARPKGWCV